MKKEIRNLLGVMGAAILSAAMITAGFLYYYGPTGRYQIENVLLKPELLSTLDYNDINPKIGQMDRYVFDEVLYQEWESDKRAWKNIVIPTAAYANFYKEIYADDSVASPSAELQALFTQTPPSKLVIKVETESQSPWQKNAKDFLQVEFVENYYRVELHQELDKSERREPWVYFYHPQIASRVQRLFNS